MLRIGTAPIRSDMEDTFLFQGRGKWGHTFPDFLLVSGRLHLLAFGIINEYTNLIAIRQIYLKGLLHEIFWSHFFSWDNT